jgi:hypothetical protein
MIRFCVSEEAGALCLASPIEIRRLACRVFTPSGEDGTML